MPKGAGLSQASDRVESSVTISRYTTFPLVLLIILTLSWLLVNGKSLIPEQFYTLDLMVLYVSWFLLTGFAWLLWVLNKHSERSWAIKDLFSSSIVRAVPSMIIAAILSVLVLFLLFEVVLGARADSFSWELAGGLIVLFGFVVAPVEEIVFRFMWPCLIGGYASQLIFASFHAVVNNWNLNLFAFNFLFGIIMWELYLSKPPQLKGKLGVEMPKAKKLTVTLFYWGLGPLIVVHAAFNIMFAFYFGGLT
jgi:hypothetical protein